MKTWGLSCWSTKSQRNSSVWRWSTHKKRKKSLIWLAIYAGTTTLLAGELGKLFCKDWTISLKLSYNPSSAAWASIYLLVTNFKRRGLSGWWGFLTSNCKDPMICTWCMTQDLSFKRLVCKGSETLKTLCSNSRRLCSRKQMLTEKHYSQLCIITEKKSSNERCCLLLTRSLTLWWIMIRKS